MIDTYGHILYGYKIDEAKLSKVLGDDFDDFEEEYMSLFGDMVGEETPGWIPDHRPYLEQLNAWISSHSDLFKKILSCAEKPEPKMMFTVIYS